MPIPDVVIAGAAKCGATALALALHHHPEFAVGREKEPRFFTGASPTYTGPLSDRYNRSLIDNETDYRRDFAGLGDLRTVDASTDYLHHPWSADRIHHANPEARIVIGLRHPLRRAWSEHMHLRRVGGETESFDDALRLEDQRRAAGWIPLFGHADRSRYSPGVRAFLEAPTSNSHMRIGSVCTGVLQAGRHTTPPDWQDPCHRPRTITPRSFPKRLKRFARASGSTLASFI